MSNDRIIAPPLSRPPARSPALHRAYTMEREKVLEELGTPPHGLSQEEAAARLARFGYNRLPRQALPNPVRIFFKQFISPLIYVLLIAAVVALFLGEILDALFIFIVLIVNALIGAVQEYSAQRSALNLQSEIANHARVERAGDAYEIDAEELVPGDIVLLESGNKVPADLKLLDTHNLEVDESLLTGESTPVLKQHTAILAEDTVLGDRINMAFAGALVTRGRARAAVVGTGLGTEIGALAKAIGGASAKPPLLVRMERFTLQIGLLIGAGAVLLLIVGISRGVPPAEIFLLAVALAVSAIPEGLPVALTVALAIGMNRMARRHVIVRRLVAVEALGSCTFIASDKTGTLTVNELTARRIVFPGQPPWEITGEGMLPEGVIRCRGNGVTAADDPLLHRLCLAAVLPNEGFLGHRDGAWSHHGDAVDVALLVMARKAGLAQHEVLDTYPHIADIPFESASRFAASLNRVNGNTQAFVKGAIEQVLPMCKTMATSQGDVPLDRQMIDEQARVLARDGFRVLAIASGSIGLEADTGFGQQHLQGLTLIGLVGMIDPLRPEAKPAIRACRQAGIEVSMVTGDHPITAMAIAKELELAEALEQVVTGPQLRDAEQVGPDAIDALTRDARVFARVEPQQKLDIVRSLQRHGHFVAVTGDGANDAPALRAAEVGVAMGEKGTDVARETADIVITDDNFTSIVNGIEEGRIAYANVRKVIFLLISTGAAELVLFGLGLLSGLPLPLVAVQLLWLNLVTNGIQDVALAFEPGEGDELRRRPRSPSEPIFNRLMIERVAISAVVVGGIAFAAFKWLIDQGLAVEEARNVTLLLMVLFENVQVLNSRSEIRSTFVHSLMRNRLLLFGTLAAQLVHIGAMYTPGLNTVLGVAPVSFSLWLQLLGLALLAVVAVEAHKALWRRRLRRRRAL